MMICHSLTYCQQIFLDPSNAEQQRNQLDYTNLIIGISYHQEIINQTQNQTMSQSRDGLAQDQFENSKTDFQIDEDEELMQGHQYNLESSTKIMAKANRNLKDPSYVPSAAEEATIKSMSSMSLINDTNNDNFENTREEINPATLADLPREAKKASGLGKQKRPVDYIGFENAAASEDGLQPGVAGTDQKKVPAQQHYGSTQRSTNNTAAKSGSNSNNDQFPSDSGNLRDADNPLDPLNALQRQKSKLSQKSSQHGKSAGGKSNISSESVKKSATKSKDHQVSKRTSDVSKQEKSLQDVLLQNDRQMERSHQTESQRDVKSKKSPGGASHSHNQSDININDLSGQGLKLNTSLDRSGGNLIATRMDPSGLLQHAPQGPVDGVSGIHVISEMSRLGSVSADPRKLQLLPPGNHARDAQPELEQQRDSTDTQKQMDFQMVNNQQLNQMIQNQSLNQSIQSLNQSLHIQKLQEQALREKIHRNQQLLASAAARNSLNHSVLLHHAAPPPEMAGMFRRRSYSSSQIDQSQQEQDVQFLSAMKKQCQQLRQKMALEVKQKLKFLVLNAVNAKKLKYMQGRILELERTLKDLKSAAAEPKETAPKDSTADCFARIDGILALMKDLAKPQQAVKEKDQELLGKIALLSRKQEQLKQKLEKEKQRGKSADSYISPDDEIPDKRISIFEQSQAQIDRSKIDQSPDLSKTEYYGQNSLYQLEHNNSQLRGFNQPLMKQFRAGPAFSRMGFAHAVDRSVALSHTGMSGLSVSNLELTQAAGNAALNRDLLARAYPTLLKNGQAGNPALNVTGLASLDQPMQSVFRLHGPSAAGGSFTNRYAGPPSHSRILQPADLQEHPADESVGVASSDPADTEISRVLPANDLNKSILTQRPQDLTANNINNISQLQMNKNLLGNQSFIGRPNLNQSIMDRRQQPLPGAPGIDKLDNTFLLSQLGGPFGTLASNARALDSSQLQILNKAAFGVDVSNILGPLSDRIDKSGIIANADISKLFAQAPDESMSMLLKQQASAGAGQLANKQNPNMSKTSESMLFKANSQSDMSFLQNSKAMDKLDQSKLTTIQKGNKNDLSHTIALDGPSNDLDGTNLNDLTVNNVTNLELLEEIPVQEVEEESLENYGTNKERSQVDQMNPENVYNQSRFIRNRGEQPSMQVILEESRAENETTIDNQGDTSYVMDKADSQEHETDNILKGIDSENNISINNETTEIKRVDTSHHNKTAAAQNLQNLSSMTPRSSDVSKVIKFFDGPTPEYLDKSRISLKGYSSNQYMTQQNNVSHPSDMYGRQETITSDFESMPFPVRASEGTTEKNLFLEHIKRYDSFKNYNTSEPSNTDREQHPRSKTSRIQQTKKSAAVLRNNQTKLPKANAISGTGGSVMSKLNKEQRERLLLRRKTQRKNASLLSSSLLDGQSSYRKLTMTERSARRASKMTSFRRTMPNETEKQDGGRVDTAGDSNQDTSRIDHQILRMRKLATSFVSESRTDQNFWKQLEQYRDKHLKWLDEKRNLHEKLKKLQLENDGLTSKIKVLKGQIATGIVQQAVPPDFDVSNILALSQHHMDALGHADHANLVEQQRLLQRLGHPGAKTYQSTIQEHQNRVGAAMNFSSMVSNLNKSLDGGQNKAALKKGEPERAVTAKDELTNVTGFDNLLGQTNHFNMDSNNMSLGASNMMPSMMVAQNNPAMSDKEKAPEQIDKSRQQPPGNEENDISLSHVTQGHSKPQSIAEIRNILRKNIQELENNNQHMQQQLVMQSSFLMDNNLESSISQMDLTRAVFGPDAPDISVIAGRPSNLAATRSGNQRYSGGPQQRNASLISKNALDESNFNCEVPDQDESQIEQNKNDLGDNYQMPQRITLDDVKQAQAQISMKSANTSQAAAASEPSSSIGPSPGKTQPRRNVGGDYVDFESGQSPVRISGPLGRISEAKSGHEISDAKLGFRRDHQDGAGFDLQQMNPVTAPGMLPINALLRQKEQFDMQQRQTAEFNDLKSLKPPLPSRQPDQALRQSEQASNMSSFFGILKLRARGSVREPQLRGEQIQANCTVRAKSSDKSEPSRQRGSTKSRNALYLERQNSLQDKNEVGSPTGVQHFKDEDDLTPLRDGKAGNSIRALNFGNLVSGQRQSGDSTGPAPGHRRPFHRYRESAETAHFNDDGQNQEGPDHARMYRNSVNQALRGSIHQVLPGDVNGKTFGAKPTVQLHINAGLPEEPDQTYLSFSDKINESGLNPMREPNLSRQDQSGTDFQVPGDGEDDGPGLGSKRKSPSGMHVQKHSEALKLREFGNSPSSSQLTSNNASREQIPTEGNGGGNKASQSDHCSSKQQTSSERITFNPNDRFKGQLAGSPGAITIHKLANANEVGQSMNQNRLFHADSQSNATSQDGSTMHFQTRATDPDAPVQVLQQSAPQPVDRQVTNPATEEAENSMNDFNAISALQSSVNEDSPEAALAGIQAAGPLTSGQKEQASFISHIQRDKDASFAIISQGNTSLIQNSQYMNASFLMAGANTSVIKSSNQNTPGTGMPLQTGQPTPFFADVKPRNTGVSKMTASQEHAYSNAISPDTSAVRPLNLDESAGQASEQLQSQNVSNQHTSAAGPTDGARFTLGQEDAFRFHAPQTGAQQTLGQPNMPAAASGLQLPEQLSAAEAEELYNLQLQQQYLQEQYLQQQHLQQQIQQQLLQQELLQQQAYLQQASPYQYDALAQQSLLDLATAQQSALVAQLNQQHSSSNLNSMMTASFAGASHDQMQQLMLSQHLIQRQQQNYMRNNNILTQYRNSLAAQGQQVDKNHIKNMFFQVVGRGSVARDSQRDTEMQQWRDEQRAQEQQQQATPPRAQQASSRSYFENLAKKKQQS